MKTALATLATVTALALSPMAASAQTATPDDAAPPMAGTGDMSGMMGGMSQGAMMDQKTEPAPKG